MELKKLISEKNSIFNKIKTDKFKPNPQNEEFFKNIEDAVCLFNKRAASVKLGSVFYSDFDTRINDLQGEIKDYVLSRDLEKKDMIDAINSGRNYNSTMNNSKEIFLINLFILRSWRSFES